MAGAATVEPRYSAAASEIAGREATVRCNSVDEWRALTASQGRPFTTEGFARVREGVVELAPSVCGSLAETVAAAPAARLAGLAVSARFGSLGRGRMTSDDVPTNVYTLLVPAPGKGGV